MPLSTYLDYSMELGAGVVAASDELGKVATGERGMLPVQLDYQLK
jgi:hypothetical protein